MTSPREEHWSDEEIRLRMEAGEKPFEPREDWEKEFDELPIGVAYIQNGQKILDLDYLKDQNEEVIKPFIRKTLAHQREEIAGEVEKLPNVIVKTVRGNQEVEVELKAKFTVDTLSAIRKER